MRVVAIGDIGVTDRMIHIGDEAMFEALVDSARERGVEVTALSSNPADTADRYGVRSLAQLGFDFRGAGARDRMRERSALLVSHASRSHAHAGGETALESTDPGIAVVDAIRAADAVVIAGGGNVASNWPMHIWERLTLARIAAAAGTPLFISGQTIGPNVTDEDAPAIAELLGAAELVGVREGASYDLALRLGVDAERLERTVDDASFLGAGALDTGAGADTRAGADGGAAGYCLVSFSLHLDGYPRERFVERMAALLDEVVESTGLEVAFLPHFGSTDPAVIAGDSLIQAEIAAAMSQPSRSIVPTTAVVAAELARDAGLIVTSRYHPAVFAAAAGVPVLGLCVDDYTRVKLTGALANFGQGTVVALADDVDLPSVMRTLWLDRAAVRSTWTGLIRDHRAASERWFTRLLGPIRERRPDLSTTRPS